MDMDIFREKFWSGVDNGVKIPECLQNTIGGQVR